ncbi:MAG: rod shape-determining protein MreD [Actinomycetota bacterium]|nr:rod shape-determining protein MreD [Actinomycetota bacterium]
MTRKREAVLICAVFACFLLQVSVAPELKLFGSQPNLLLVLAIVVAIQDSPLTGAIVGFSGGLLQAFAGYQIPGLSAFTFATTAYLGGILKELFMTYSVLLPVILIFLMSVFELLLHQFALMMLGQGGIPPMGALSMLLPVSIYNVLAGIVIYPLLRSLSFQEREKLLTLTGKGS